MHFAQEVLEPEGLREVAGMEVGPKELQMAKMLVDSMAGQWSPERYQDRYQDAVREMIEHKVKQLPDLPKAPRKTVSQETMDIVAILQRSLDESAAKGGKRPATVKAPARTTRHW
jgi:DNA end-binding protein Ku